MPRIIAFILLLASAMVPSWAHATCLYNTSDGQPGWFLFNPTALVTINPDAYSVGQVMVTLTGTQGQAQNVTDQNQYFTSAAVGTMSVGFRCNAVINNTQMRGTGAVYQTGSPAIYKTNIPGVGVSMTISGYSYPYSYTMAYLSTVRPQWAPYTVAANYLLPNAPITVRLIKIGPVTSGGTLDGEFAGWYTADGQELFSYRFSPITIKPTYATCAPTVGNQTVNLAAASAGAFGGSGYTTATDFTVDLVCSGGTTAAKNLWVTFTDAANPGNTSNMLSLAPGSTASNVAVQILYKGNAISYGPDSSAPNNTNQFQLATSQGNGNLSIPLSARYAATGTGSVSGGSVKAVATFTFSYQ